MALVWFFKVDTQETCSKTKLTKSRKFYSIPPRGNRDILSSSWISTKRQTKRPGPRGVPIRGWSPKKPTLKQNTALSSNCLKVVVEPWTLSEQFKYSKGLGLIPELCQTNFCIQRSDKNISQDLANNYGSKYSTNLTQNFDRLV